jgi:hypothetical protein
MIEVGQVFGTARRPFVDFQIGERNHSNALNLVVVEQSQELFEVPRKLDLFHS